MGHPDFENKGSAIGRFIEECGEALAAAGKTVRFGWGSWNPLLPEDKRENNEDWLRREISDLETSIARLKKSRSWGIDSPAPEQPPAGGEGLREAATSVVVAWDEYIPDSAEVGDSIERLRAALKAQEPAAPKCKEPSCELTAGHGGAHCSCDSEGYTAAFCKADHAEAQETAGAAGTLPSIEEAVLPWKEEVEELRAHTAVLKRLAYTDTGDPWKRIVEELRAESIALTEALATERATNVIRQEKIAELEWACTSLRELLAKQAKRHVERRGRQTSL